MNTSESHNPASLVQQQFAPVASAYVTSSTHAHGADLARLVELAELSGNERVLDVATGGGHTALAFASHARFVVACDLTLSMLQAAEQHITTQHITNVSYCRARAEHLPFAHESFHIVTCRVAAHHFADIQAFVTETARILKPGGKLLVSDHIGLSDKHLDAFMDKFERWRDPSHVRAYTWKEWHQFCRAAGLHLEKTEQDMREPYEFESWTARMRMSEENRAALEAWLLQAQPRFREFFQIVAQDGHVVSLQGTFGILVALKK